MTSFRPLVIAAAAAAFSIVGLAQTPAEHDAHHPAAAASAARMAVPKGVPGETMARIDAQMKLMRGMHDKMMAARTPQERNALMAEHMQVMQGGMAMMGGMGSMGARQPMLEKRMEMMESMMQMMMDRMPEAPTK